MKLNWNFQRGWGILGQIPSVGEVWIIYGSTQKAYFAKSIQILLFIVNSEKK